MKKFLIISSLAIFVLITGYFVLKGNNFSRYISYMGPLIPPKIKTFLKDNILVFNKIEDQNKIINKQKEKIDQFSLSTESKFRSNNLKILFNQITDNNNFKISNNEFNLKKFSTSSIITGKWEVTGGSFYLEKFNNNLIIVSATGIISHNKLDFYKKKYSNFTSIKSNLEELITDPEFYVHSPFGIKDILIKDEYLYVSYTHLLKKNCYNTSVLRAKMNLNNLFFENYFIPKKCVKMNNIYGQFSAHQSGGRMAIFKDNRIILTVGDYGFRDHSQNINDTTFGKTILISLNGKDYDVLSKGHRNHQGLYYDKNRNIIYMTEHGPQGGDEININYLNSNKEKNYGWPISSYGEHYGFKQRDDNHPYYKKAPLYKSHSKYGFQEPIKYFVPSIGISQTILIDKNIYGENYYLIFGSLGNKIEEGDMSAHFLTLDEKDTILNHEIIKLNERVRDILKVNNGDVLFFSLETSSSIGVMIKL